jgi:WD40 repeat protein
MRLWDIASGECRFREILHGTQRKNFPEKVSFLPDGKGIALLGSDGRVRIRSISSGEERWVMDFPGATATGFAMSSDGSVIAIAGVRQNGTPRFGQYAEPVDTEIVVVQTQTGAIISRVAGQFWEPVMSFSPDGRFLSVRTISNGLRVWDVSESETSPQLVLALDIESLIEFFPKGRYAVTAGADNYANIWDLTKFDEGADVADDMESINGVAFGPDGGLAVSHRDSSAPENYWRSWGDRIPDQAMDQWRDRASAFQRVFQAESGTSELLIRRRGDGTPIAWLPLSVKDLQEHPFAHIWAGIQGGHLVVFELSDNSDTETKYGPDDTIHCA